jgi:hypothetical protein
VAIVPRIASVGRLVSSSAVRHDQWAFPHGR